MTIKNKIKTSKKGNRYIGNKKDVDTIKWECKSCKVFKLEKDIVGGCGDIICKECLMNDKYKNVIN